MAQKVKLPYRHGVLSYGSDAINQFSVENGVIKNNHKIIFSIAAGANNYYFEILPNTVLGDINEDGVIIAYMDHSNASISFAKIKSTLQQIYVDDLPIIDAPNSIKYNKSKPRGYVFSSIAGWCPRDFLVIAEVSQSLPTGVPLVSQLGEYGYSDTIVSYNPKVYNQEYVCSIQQSELFVLEDFTGLKENFNITLFDDGIEAANDIGEYTAVSITPSGMVSVCTANDDSHCIGIATKNIYSGEYTSSYASRGTIKNSYWNFSTGDIIYIDDLGRMTNSLDFVNVKNIKQVGIAIGSNAILLDIKGNILINEI